jgi:hypothetical protein
MAVFAQAPTQGERDRALSALHGSLKLFRDATTGLTPAQWSFKPAPDRWSIAEVAEHLALIEQGIFAHVTTDGMKTPATTEGKEERAKKDEQILKMLVDRSQKFQAPEGFRPTGQFKTGTQAAEAMVASRMKTAVYVRDTQDALRDHLLPHPALGPLDLYQWFLLLAGHAERHALQILEVKADPKYPAR